MAAPALPTDEIFEAPAFDVRALVRRAALPAALAAVVVAVALLAGGPLEAFLDALRRALEADPRWVVAAMAFELLSFAGYVALLWLVGGRATSRLGFRESVQVTLGGAAATRLLPTAGVGGAALTVWALRRSGLTTARATRALFAFLVVLYAVFLISIAATGTLLALEGDGTLALTAVPAAGAVLVMALALGAGALGAAPAGAGRVRSGVGVFGSGVRDAIAHVLSPDPRLLGAVAWWGFDMAVLWAMLNAFGAPPALAVVILAYFVGQVGNTLPIPGAVSGGLVGVLLAFGVAADLAIVSVLAYRAIAIWLPAPIGLAALGGLRRTLARWAAEPTPVLEVIPPSPVPVAEAGSSRASVAAVDDPVRSAGRPRPCEGRWRERWPCHEPAAA
jgi:putative heme transporter